MNLLQNLLLRLSRFPVKSRLPIVPAFISGGIQYYQFGGDMPVDRQMNALPFYREFRMKTSEDYLKLHCDAMDTVLNAPQVKLTDVAILHQQLKERLTLIFEPETAYKLASVVFFDRAEDPYSYDAKYCAEKIKKWKKDKKVKDFFLQMPLQDLIPGLKKFTDGLDIYSQIANQITLKHLESISIMLLSEAKSMDLLNKLKSQIISE